MPMPKEPEDSCCQTLLELTPERARNFLVAREEDPRIFPGGT